MTKDEFAKFMEANFDELQKLREAGQKEYAGGDDNAFGNFERLSVRLGISRE